MKNNQPFSCLWFQEQVLFFLKKHPLDSGSEIRKKFIPDPDPGGKKAPDQGSGSATLVRTIPGIYWYRYLIVMSQYASVAGGAVDLAKPVGQEVVAVELGIVHHDGAGGAGGG
jgi:hypothetical protein